MLIKADQANRASQNTAKGQMRERNLILWVKFQKNKLAVISLWTLILLYIIALFAPYLAPHDINYMNFDNIWGSPSWTNPFGTDSLGRDLLSLVIYGSRVSLSIGIIAMLIAIFIGTLLGAISGYYGGIVDSISMRFTDIVLCFPTFFLVLTIVALFGNGIYKVIIIIGLTSWMGIARLVRSQFLMLKNKDFVEGAKALGASDLRIIFQYLLPNSISTIIVAATLRIGNIILTEAILSFLGLGVKQGTISWGGLLQEAQAIVVMKETPWVAFFPGAFIFITVLAFNLLGDGLRDALAPR